jgi:hypothetical protein
MNTSLSLQTAATTFTVADVERATLPRPEMPYAEALRVGLGNINRVVEAYSRDTRPLVFRHPALADVHSFVYALTIAYDRHYPLVLSPDMIWLLIAQGFARHLNVHAETFRERFVSHQGQAKIIVRRDEFVRGFAGNDWEGVFSEFSDKIKCHIGEKGYALVVKEFSTTGIVEKAAFEITLMDAVQQFFDYLLVTRCGIPEITLEGTPQDWEAVRAGAAALADYDLNWWMEHLLPVLDQFVAATRGNVDREFWRNIYKIDHQSGGPFISGHLVNLFPYLLDSSVGSRASVRSKESNSPMEREVPVRNTNLGIKAFPPEVIQTYRQRGVMSTELPSALSVAPFTWQYLGTQIPMEFVAGFIGMSQNKDTLALRPEIGWAIRERAP